MKIQALVLRITMALSLSAGLALQGGCAKKDDAQQPAPYTYGANACQAGFVIDFRTGQCVTIQTQQSAIQGQAFQGALKITNYNQYKLFVKEYNQSSPSFCKQLVWNGWHPSFEDCVNLFIGNDSLLDMRFPAFIQSGSPVQSGLTSGTNQYNTVRLPINLAFYIQNEGRSFELRSPGNSGTYSWNAYLQVIAPAMTFVPATGTISDTSLAISVKYREIEIASGTVNRQ